MNSSPSNKKKSATNIKNEDKINYLNKLQITMNQGGHIIKPLLKHKKKRELIKRGLSCNWTPEEVNKIN